jgi:osmoprotectant transport system substrate-binding protein
VRSSRLLGAVLGALILTACGSSSPSFNTSLPGFNRPAVTIGDKNYTEEFLLGQMYYQALTAQGYRVTLDPNIGQTEVTFHALVNGRLAMYPESVNTWNSLIAQYHTSFPSAASADRAAAAWARSHGITLLRPTPFNDTNALAVTTAYARAHGLSTLGDLRKVAAQMTLGAPPQFQDSSTGLPAIEHAYGFTPRAVTGIDIGTQAQELSKNVVQSAWITTTDGALAGSGLTMLRDPLDTLGWGNVVPVVTDKVLAEEGPAFARTINRVTRLLSLRVIRRLNAEVDVGQQTPQAVARAFLLRHGLVPKGPPPGG